MRPVLLAMLMAVALLWPAVVSADVETGDKPEFSVTTLDGDELDSKELRGKVVLVDFWATWCDPCTESFPFYSQLAADYSGDLVVVAVSLDSDKEKVREFLKGRDVAFDVVWQKKHPAARQFGPQTFPTSYLIDRKGVVRHVHPGFDEETQKETEAQIEALVEER